MEGEHEVADLLVLPPRLGLGVYISDSEDSCNSSVERWVLQESDDATLYSAKSPTTAYASALESPFSSDASLTPSETSSDSVFVLDDDGEEDDPSKEVPWSEPLMPKNNRDYALDCQKAQNIMMRSLRFDAKLLALQTKRNKRTWQIEQEHLTRSMMAVLMHREREPLNEKERQDTMAAEKKTKEESSSTWTPSVSEETTVTDDADELDGSSSQDERKDAPDVSSVIADEGKVKVDRKVESTPKSSAQKPDGEVQPLEEARPPSSSATGTSGLQPSSQVPHPKTETEDALEESAASADVTKLQGSSEAIASVPVHSAQPQSTELPTAKQNVEKTMPDLGESLTQVAPPSQPTSVVMPPAQTSPPERLAAKATADKGTQNQDRPSVEVSAQEPMPMPSCRQSTVQGFTVDDQTSLHDPTMQKGAVAESSSGAAQSMPQTSASPEEQPVVLQQQPDSGQQQGSPLHEAMPSVELLEISVKMQVPSAYPPPEALFSLDTPQPVKEEEKVALHAAKTAIEFEAYHKRIAQQMLHSMGDYATDLANKAVCKEITKNMRLDVSQISSQESQIQIKVNNILQTISQVDGLPGVIYAYVQLARFLVSKCAGISDSLVFAVAKTTVGVMQHHPQLLNMLLSFLHEVSILSVPKCYSSETTHDLLLEKLGFRDIPGVHLRKENTDEFIARQSGYIKFYAAIIELDSRVHGLEYGWSYLSRMLNNLPRTRITASALMSFLSVAGYALFKKYKRQFYKVLLYIHSRFLVGLATSNDAEAQAVYSRLQTYLQNEQFSKPPEAKSMPHTAASFRIHT